jgi:hypothetical protein
LVIIIQAPDYITAVVSLLLGKTSGCGIYLKRFSGAGTGEFFISCPGGSMDNQHQEQADQGTKDIFAGLFNPVYGGL